MERRTDRQIDGRKLACLRIPDCYKNYIILGEKTQNYNITKPVLSESIATALVKAFFSTKKYLYSSYFSTKTYVVGTH